jgi:hypothetical protein
MPNLEQRAPGIPQGYTETFPEPIAEQQRAVPTPTAQGYEYNPFLRSSFPGGTTTDALRQLYGSGLYIRRFWPARQGF